MVTDLKATFADIRANRAVRAVVVNGAGRGFCSGANMGGGDDVPEQRARPWARRSCPDVPGAHRGVDACGARASATGDRGGARRCRRRRAGARAGERSACCQPRRVLRVALHPSGLVVLRRGHELPAAAHRRARHARPSSCSRGGASPAEEADRFGMLNRLVPREELLDAALDLAAGVIANSEYGVYMTKLGLWANLDASSLRRGDGAREPHAGAGHVHRQHGRSRGCVPREARPGVEADVSGRTARYVPWRVRSSPLATLPPDARGSASSTTSRSGNHSRDTPRPPGTCTTSSSSSVVPGRSSA